MHLGKTYSDPGLLGCGLHGDYALCQHNRSNPSLVAIEEALVDVIEAKACPLENYVYFYGHRPGPGVIEDRATYHAARFVFSFLNTADSNYDH